MGQRILHTSGTGSKLIGLPEVTLLTRVARHLLRLRAHAQNAYFRRLSARDYSGPVTPDYQRGGAGKKYLLGP